MVLSLFKLEETPLDTPDGQHICESFLKQS